MLSFRSVFGASTGALRQILPSFSRRSAALVSRPFSQIARLSLGNGLRLLRSGKQTNNVGVASVGSTLRQVEQVRGMKTRSSVKRLCDGCKVCRDSSKSAFSFTAAEVGIYGGLCVICWIEANTVDLQPVRRKNRVYIIW